MKYFAKDFFDGQNMKGMKELISDRR